MTRGDIFTGPKADSPRYFSIAPGRPFLNDLAIGLTAALRNAGFEPPDAAIYLPTRRAARALNEAFLAASGASAALTPHIRALGDIDEDEFALDENDAAAGWEDELALAPAISSARRRLTLARLVAERDKIFFDGQRRWAGAIAAADELGGLLDSLYTEEVDPGALGAIVPEGLASHWQSSLEFLEIVTRAWPAHLAEQGLSDPAARRIALIDAQTQRWRDTPPQTPIIIAGTTGSTPAVARMMKCVAGLAFGCVVLPGLDLAAPAHVWDAIDEPHPQSGLKALIGALETMRGDVRPWPVASGKDAASAQEDVSGENARARASLITVALRPANASDDWRRWAEDAKSNTAVMNDALGGLALVEARDEEGEAGIVALRLREVIAEPERTVMLVTPDRDLARRVAMKMRRWDVNVDDSAGAPFANTPAGIFLRLTAAWLGDVSHPVRLMAMIDHPLFGGGVETAALARLRGKIDRALRGLRPLPGIDGLRAKLFARNDRDSEQGQAETEDPQLMQLLLCLAEAAAMWPGDAATFSERFEAHIAASERLCAQAPKKAGPVLWRGDAGEIGAVLLAQLRGNLDLIINDQPSEYADIFTRLIAGGVVRRRMPAHPRISILGPLEARLQSADVVILAGLNEGVWPRDAAVDPFLSRPMRKALGLPSPERRIGLAAHDFAQLTASPQVMLTRSSRAAGKPTKPSRWIVRLKNILKGAGYLQDIDASAQFEALAGLLDAPDGAALASSVSSPQPRPPVEARPTQFSVTQIEKLLRDPYAIYARRVLRLNKTEALGDEFSARHMGNLFHSVLEAYAAEAPPEAHAARVAKLQKLFNERARPAGFEPRHEAFWRRRLGEAFEELAQWDAMRRAIGAPVVLEGRGEHSFTLAETEYKLTAIADRIDRLENGDAFIVDYKTGAPPTLKAAQKFSPQLPLTGFIIEQGGFADFGRARVDGFEYLRVIGAKPSDKPSRALGDDAAQSIEAARDGLFAVLAHFADAANAYPSQPRPQYTDDFGDFDHLARRRERAAQIGDDGGDGQ